MGQQVRAVIEIDGFRLKGDPDVIHRQKVADFLADLAALPGVNPKRGAEPVRWETNDRIGPEAAHVRPEEWNNPGGEWVNEALWAETEFTFNGLRWKARTTIEGGNEYDGNGRPYSLILYPDKPKWNEDITVDGMAGVLAVVQEFRGCLSHLLVKYRLKKKLTAAVVCVTT